MAAKDTIEQKKAQLLAILKNSSVNKPAEEEPKEQGMEEGKEGEPAMEGEEEEEEEPEEVEEEEDEDDGDDEDEE